MATNREERRYKEVGKQVGQVVSGSVRLSDEEIKILQQRAHKFNKRFPGAGITMGNFLDMALRVGIDIELRAIRAEMEAEHADNK